GRAPDKTGDHYNIVVIDTTRGNPDWRDIDTWSARGDLWKAKLPRADGIFYILVHDFFGRETRFDIENQNGSRAVSKPDPTTCVIDEDFKAQNRWWQATTNGTSASGPEPFTDISSASFNKTTKGDTQDCK